MRARSNLHILTMPFSETTRAFEHCAFTARTRVFASMMTKAGYTTYLYGGENNEALVSEHVCVIDRDEQSRAWPGYDPKRDVFNSFDPEGEGWRLYNSRAVEAIRARAEPGDIICVTMGTSHRPVAQAFPELFAVETGIGYSGVWAPFRVYESRAWMNYLVGRYGPSDDARFYDAVIPRAYEVSDFPAGDGSGGYVLFVGRLTARKGPHIAAMAAARAGMPLLVAGQGAAKVEPGRITCTDGTTLEGDVSYLGVLGADERAEVMGGAVCVLVPTTYLEPFGGVSVEAQLCGTPAVVSEWGGLPENVEQDVTGFRCTMLRDFVHSARMCSGLDRAQVRDNAQQRWGSEPVADRFDDYFTRLQTLRGEGWYAELQKTE